jgi:hypothetical protein
MSACLNSASAINYFVDKYAILYLIGGKLDLSSIGQQSNKDLRFDAISMQAFLAIDDRLEMSTSALNQLVRSKCATSRTRSSVPSWLQVCLYNVYLISRASCRYVLWN